MSAADDKVKQFVTSPICSQCKELDAVHDEVFHRSVCRDEVGNDSHRLVFSLTAERFVVSYYSSSEYTRDVTNRFTLRFGKKLHLVQNNYSLDVMCTEIDHDMVYSLTSLSKVFQQQHSSNRSRMIFGNWQIVARHDMFSHLFTRVTVDGLPLIEYQINHGLPVCADYSYGIGLLHLQQTIIAENTFRLDQSSKLTKLLETLRHYLLGDLWNIVVQYVIAVPSSRLLQIMPEFDFREQAVMQMMYNIAPNMPSGPTAVAKQNAKYALHLLQQVLWAFQWIDGNGKHTWQAPIPENFEREFCEQVQDASPENGD
jgi:hypothetical protein